MNIPSKQYFLTKLYFLTKEQGVLLKQDTLLQQKLIANTQALRQPVQAPSVIGRIARRGALSSWALGVGFCCQVPSVWAAPHAESPPMTEGVGAVAEVDSATGLTLSGATGNPLFPTAHIPRQGSWLVQGSYFDLGQIQNVENDFGLDQNIGELRFSGLHVAGRPWKAPLEITLGVEKLRARGKTVFDVPGFVTDETRFEALDRAGFSAGVKYAFSPAGQAAAGKWDLSAGAGYSQALLNNAHIYVVGSRAVSTGSRSIQIHLGARYDHFRFTAVDRQTGPLVIGGVDDIRLHDSSHRFSLFGGMEVPLDRDQHWNLIGEIGTRNSDFDIGFQAESFVPSRFRADLKGGFPYSLSVRYAGRGWVATAGVMRQGLVEDSGLFAQLGKAF